MKYFFYGDFELKINDKITEIVSKNNFLRKYLNLDSDTFSSILNELGSENLFGDKDIFIIDFTESDADLALKFLKDLPKNCDLIITFHDTLEKSSKILKNIPSDFQVLEFKRAKIGNVFNFVDQLVAKDLVKSYQELKKLDDNEVLIFNNIVGSIRSLISFKCDLAIKNKVIPFKASFYKKNSEKYSLEELLQIYESLYQNDLKFKRGEINGEMLLLHSVNIFFLQKNGSIK